MMTALSLLVAPFAEWLKGRAARQQVKEEGKIRIEEAKVRGQELAAERAATAEADYDLEAQKQMQYSWKDEYMLLILSFPFIASFVPVVQDYVITGWTYISQAPQWYQWSFLGVLVSTFGLRWWVAKQNPLSK